jgi:hypothetical protein
MIPEFRKGVLCLETESADTSVGPEDNVVTQLQFLFANLQNSDKSSVCPKGFCHALKDFDGAPTNLMEQQDASEFLTKFFQQAEERLVGTPQENLLKDCFGGVVSNKLTADGGHSSRRPEPFYFISLGVGGGIANLEESLREFVRGESVEYSWNTLTPSGVQSRSLPTVKRTVIQALPKHLLFHLRRFDYDYETYMLVKKNDRFEFPLELNMEPFLDPEIEATDEDCRYVLSGVVTHMGTTESGHYYSFSKDRSSGKWFEFNDSSVRAFDIAELDEETFGGPLNASHSIGPSVPGVGKPTHKIKSAFMVIYDKVPLQVEKTERLEPKSGSLSSASDTLLETIYQDNVQFWKEKLLYNKEYYTFMTRLFSLSTDLSVSGVFKSAITFLLVILVQASEKELLVEWADKLAAVLQDSADLCAWMLRLLIHSDNHKVLERLILKESAHAPVMKLICTAIQAGAVHGTDESFSILSGELIKLLLDLMKPIVANATMLSTTLSPLPYIFQPIYSVCRSYPDLAQVFILKGILNNLLSLFLFDSFDHTNVPSEFIMASSIQTGLVASIAIMLRALETIETNNDSDDPETFKTLMSSDAFPCRCIFINTVYHSTMYL